MENKKNNLDSLFDEIDKEKKKKKKHNKNTKTKPNFNKITINNNNNNYSFKGLKNFGNSCYSNVIIQILSSIPEFTQILFKMYSLIENDDNIFNNYFILSRLVEIINNYNIKNTTIASNYLREIQFKFDQNGNQNDAHEFLFFLLNALNDEILTIKITNDNNNNNNDNNNNNENEWLEVKKNNKTMKQTNSISNFTTTILSDVFQGILKHDISSKGHSISNAQIEPFFTLNLDNNEKNLNKMLENFFSKKHIENSDKNTQTFLEKIPNILIIKIKGFYYDKKLLMPIKIKEPLIYNSYLKIDKKFFSPSLQKFDYEYELFSVIIHKGKLATEGHYICYCKDIKKNNWVYIDDNNVMNVNEENLYVFRPYILFFRKK